MQVLLNANGTANRAYRPYIDQEETMKVFSLYDPERPVNWGLYNGPQPVTSTLQQNYLIDNPAQYPISTIDGRCNYQPNNQSTLEIINGVYPQLANQLLQRSMAEPHRYPAPKEMYAKLRMQNSRCSCGCVRSECECPSGCSCNCNT
jgi:hypothetical protein